MLNVDDDLYFLEKVVGHTAQCPKGNKERNQQELEDLQSTDAKSAPQF